MRYSNRRSLFMVCAFWAITAAWCSSLDNSVKRSVFDAIQFRVERDIGLIGGEEPNDNEWNQLDYYDIVNDAADHVYYTLTGSYGSDVDVKKNWIDLAKMLSNNNTSGNVFSHGYRRALGVTLSFDFPFYGYQQNNITIATGGFLYFADLKHKWFDAIQYIAPLMADFDATSNDSNIIYADDGEKFVVEYSKVKLRDQVERGAFTFQVILHKNGGIIFIYKDMPMAGSEISQSQHPVKLGISDAYIFKHNVSFYGYVIPKREIYEYRRVEVPAEKIVNNTVITFTALPSTYAAYSGWVNDAEDSLPEGYKRPRHRPLAAKKMEWNYVSIRRSCLSLSSCSACANANLKHFTCSWCSDGDSDSFCTDDAGLQRRSQQWVDQNCKQQGDVRTVCPATDSSSSSVYLNGSSPDNVLDKKFKDAATASKLAERGGFGYAMLAVILASCFVVVG